MQKLLVSACLLTSLVAYGENLKLLPRGSLISKYEWEALLSNKSCSDDIVVMLDGTKLCGRIEKIPPLSYNFGNLIFTPAQVAAIALTQSEKGLKIQYITREGQDYLASLSRGRFVFSVPDENELGRYVKKEIDPQLVHFILLKERETLNSTSFGTVSSIDLSNGDHLPAILYEDPIILTDGWNELVLKPQEILELSFNGGLHGRILKDGLPSDLKFMFVKEPFLRVRVPKNGQTLKLPWDQIEYIEAYNGGFKKSDDHPFSYKQWLEDPKEIPIQTTPDSIGNNKGTLLEGAQGSIALEPSAFDGLELLGAEPMHEVPPIFDPAEEQEWKLEIAFEDMIAEPKAEPAHEQIAMLNKEEFQAIAEQLIYEDIKKVDVNPPTFDVKPLVEEPETKSAPAKDKEENKKKASVSVVAWDPEEPVVKPETPEEELAYEPVKHTPPQKEPQPHALPELTPEARAIIAHILAKDEGDDDGKYDPPTRNGETPRFTQEALALIQEILAEEEPPMQTAIVSTPMIFSVAEEKTAPAHQEKVPAIKVPEASKEDFDLFFGRDSEELTEAEQKLLEFLLSDEGMDDLDKEHIKELPGYLEKMAFLAEEDINAAINHPDYDRKSGAFIPMQGSPSLLIKAPPIYFDLQPVTNRDYEIFVLATGHQTPPHWEKGRPPAGQEYKPVVNVSYGDAEAYAEWEGKRLPTQTEWSRAVKKGLYTKVAIKEWTSTPASANSKRVFTGSSFQTRNENWVDHSTGFRTVVDLLKDSE